MRIAMKPGLISAANDRIPLLAELVSDCKIDEACREAELIAAWLGSAGREGMAREALRVPELLEIRNFYGAGAVVKELQRRLGEIAVKAESGGKPEELAGCISCGKRISASHRFCMHCGARQNRT